MKFKRFFVFALGSAFILTNPGRPIAAQAEMVRKLRWTDSILLMQYVTDGGFNLCSTPVTFEYCESTKSHKHGFSSYTWYQNTARGLTLKAGTGVTTAKPEIGSFAGSNVVLMKHFHNCRLNEKGEAVRISNKEDAEAHRSHSFFGQLYYYPNGTSGPVVNPDSPNPNPNA